jgi:hypothetical protein
VALRLDVSRIRDALGPQALERLRAELAAADSSADRQLMIDAFAGADTLWAALRPAESAAGSDVVIVLRGAYARFDPTDYTAVPRFRLPRDLGGDWRRYDRDPPKERSAPARIYARGTELLVLVSVAEIDSVERSLERGLRDTHVTPPSQGTVSLEARADAVVEAIEGRSPAAARVLRRADRLRGHAELSAGLTLELEVVFEDPETARRATDAAGLLARALRTESGAVASIAARTTIEAIGTSLVLRLKLGDEELAALVRCFAGDPAACRAGASQ